MARPFRRSSLIFRPIGLSLLVFAFLAVWYRRGYVRTGQSDTNHLDKVAKASAHEDILEEIAHFVAGIQRDQCEAETIFGKRFFERSVAYAGTRTRLRRLVRRLIDGDPISIGYLGGSVTGGAGVGPIATYHYLWPAQTFDLLSRTFPSEDHRLQGVGFGGAGSRFFAWCGALYLDEDVDLIILEHAVNNDGAQETSAAYENELVGMLNRPNKPAVIGIEFFQLSNLYGEGGINAAGIHRYYDTPYLSLKGPLLPELIAHPDRVPLFFGRGLMSQDVEGYSTIDMGHVGLRGHYAMASIVAHFIREEALRMFSDDTVAADPEELKPRHGWDRNVLGDKKNGWLSTQQQFDDFSHDLHSWRDERMWGGELYHNDVPRVRMFDQFNWDKEESLLDPRCETISGPGPIIRYRTVDPGLELDDDGEPTGAVGTGWAEWEATQSVLHKSYIRTVSRGAILQIDVDVKGRGDVELQYLRSNRFELGKVACWWDNERGKATELDGQWDVPQNIGFNDVVGEGISEGMHHLHCQLIEGKEFRIIALMLQAMIQARWRQPKNSTIEEEVRVSTAQRHSSPRV